MTNRERWIIYPLLLLAVGASIRDNLLGRVDTKNLAANIISADQGMTTDGIISCRKLIVHEVLQLGGPQTAGAIQLTVGQGGGRVFIVGPNGKAAVALGVNSATNCGVLEICDGEGKPHVALYSSEGGGVVQTLAAENKNLITLEHDRRGAGRIAVYDAQGDLYFVLPTIGPIRNLQVPAAAPVTDPQAPEAQPQVEETQPDPNAPLTSPGEPAAAQPATP